MNSFILLVEDSASDEELMLRALRKAGIPDRVVVARDGAEALDHLFGSAPSAGETQLPRVVLLDLNLPKIGGLQVLSRIRSEEHTKHLPVVVLTSSSLSTDLESSYRLGANSYVVKPIAFDQFSQVVSHLGTYWTCINHPPEV
jgi:two-component system response regulator